MIRLNNSIIFLGVRGSMSVPGSEALRYGGATTCFAVELAGERILIDAGTGLWNLRHKPEWRDKNVTLLLTHPHADHMMGLAFSLSVFDFGQPIDVYGRTRGGMTVKEQIDKLFSPPLWPVGMDVLASGMRYYDVRENFRIGNVEVKTMEGFHPGGVTLYRLTGGGKSIAVMTDSTLTDENRAEKLAFCRDCDLLVIDGQYTDEEWRGRETFGHNTQNMAVSFASACGARTVRLVHHEPGHTDGQLAAIDLPDNCRLAYEGEEVIL